MRKKLNRGTIIVHLPRDAKLYVDGVRVPMTSRQRAFTTPTLRPGRKYYYILTAKAVRGNKPIKEKRRVVVSAGKKVRVDFRDLTAVSTAKR